MTEMSEKSVVLKLFLTS